MMKPTNEAAELALGDLDRVVGGGKIGEATQHTSGLFKAASDIGQAAVLAPIGELIANIRRH